jgi:hypothetical protein
MATCSFCGKKSGWFKQEHDECVRSHETGMDLIKSEVENAILLGRKFSDIALSLRHTASLHWICDSKLKSAISLSFGTAAEKLALEAKVRVDTFKALNQFGADAGMSPDEIGRTKGYMAAMQALMLWGVVNGEPVDLGQSFSFNLDEGEKPILKGCAVYLQDTLQRSKQGSPGTVSIPSNHGIRYNIGSLESQPVETQAFKQVDSGYLYLSTRNLYFEGQHKAFGLSYEKIFKLRPYDEAVGMFRKGTDATLELFLTGAGVPYMTSTTYKILTFLTSPEGRALYSR